MVKKILSSLGLIYSPELSVIPSPTKTKETRQKTETIPENVVFSSGRAFVQTDRQDGFDADILHDTDKRQKTLTDKDKRQISLRHLKQDKGQFLKPYWFLNLSANETAQTIKKKGFSKRTIESYYAVFNSR